MEKKKILLKDRKKQTKKMEKLKLYSNIKHKFRQMRW